MNSDPSIGEEGHMEARYANCLNVGHNAFEFVLMFGQVYENAPDGSYHTHIVTGPQYVREFLEILRISIDRYEQAYGPIQRS